MKILQNFTISDIKGFKASGVCANLKKSNKKDLAVIYSKDPAVAAGVFTTNTVKAAPVLYDIKNINNKNIQAIVINSGNANACTGSLGLKNTHIMAESLAHELSLKKEETLVLSTGVIGVQLDIEKVKKGITDACNMLDQADAYDAAKAILTTDTFIKEIAVEFIINNKKVQIAGIAKGSGMISPNMATLLSVIATNLNISKELLHCAFQETVDDSYNMISVDGDMSTNDTAVILANGTANNDIISHKNEDYYHFVKALNLVNKSLARLIAKDGEGATKLLQVDVINTNSKENARKIAKAIINSNLVKCAFFGEDANWGRILCAMGSSDAVFDINKIDLSFKSKKGEINLMQKGVALDFSEENAKKILAEKNIFIIVNLNLGSCNISAWGCDLSYDYVKINSDYRS